jgi:osmoprotectant transport system substrate-binding protein
MSRRTLTTTLTALVATSALTLSGCGNADPLSPTSPSARSRTIVVGSQDYYSNEIIAEIYAQALEKAGYTIDR